MNGMFGKLKLPRDLAYTVRKYILGIQQAVKAVVIFSDARKKNVVHKAKRLLHIRTL